MKFSLGREPRMDAEMLELPEGLKDIGDSDLEIEDFDEGPFEDFSVDGNTQKFNKSKIEIFPHKLKESSIMHKLSVDDKVRSKVQDDDSGDLENMDTVGNIEVAEELETKQDKHQVSYNTHLQHLKDKFGDYIDSSGGTIDAVDLNDNGGNDIPVPEIHNLSNLHANHYSSTNVITIQPKEAPKFNTLEDDSAMKTKERLKELTTLTGENCKKDSNIEYPLKPGQALRNFMEKLSDYEKGEILDYRKIWFLGLEASKVDGSPLKPYNYGYDDDKGDYKVVLKDHIGYRFEVIEPLGKGSFGQALRCFDHERKEMVALKIIRNKKKFQHQAGVEVKILKHLRDRDSNDDNNIIKIKDYIVFRKHL